MLNEVKDQKKGLSCFGEDTSLYSQSHSSHDGAGESKCLSDEGIGLLIIDGEDMEGEEEIKSGKIPEKDSLSIPDSVFLPSEVRSVAAVSCVTHENEKNVVKESKEANRIIDNVGTKNLSSAMPPRQNAGIFYRLGQLRSYIFHQVAAFCDSSFNIVQLFPVPVLFTALLLFTSWRSQVWKNEALRMSEELQKQSTLLPLTLSVLMERQSLIEKQNLLEQELIKLSRGGEQDKYNFEGVFSDDETDDTLLSIKNCYVEASLSLGRCSKEWQKWWSDANDSSPGDAKGKEFTEYYSDDDGFTEEMAKLVRWGYSSLESRTAKSISFIEKKLNHLSFVGMKDMFTDDYIQSIVQSTPFPNIVSNNDTGGRIDYLNLNKGTDGFNRAMSIAMSRLWNSEGASGEV